MAGVLLFVVLLCICKAATSKAESPKPPEDAKAKPPREHKMYVPRVIYTYDVFPDEDYKHQIEARGLVRFKDKNGQEQTVTRKQKLEEQGGAQGKVLFRLHFRKEKDRLIREEVAIKVVKNDLGLMTIVDEIAALAYVKDKVPYCTQLKAVYRGADMNQPEVYMVMNFIGMGNVNKVIVKNQKQLDEKRICMNFMRILTTLYYFRQHNVLHRDIKMQNLLLDRDYRVFVVDLGLAKIFRPDDPHKKEKIYCGTRTTMAPQVIIKDAEYSFEADLWSAVVVLYMWFTADGIGPFDHICTHECRPMHMNPNLHHSVLDELHLANMKKPLVIPGEIPPDAADIIRGVLKFDPKDRMTLDEVIKHKWFKKHNAEFTLYDGADSSKIEGLNSEPLVHRSRTVPMRRDSDGRINMGDSSGSLSTSDFSKMAMGNANDDDDDTAGRIADVDQEWANDGYVQSSPEPNSKKQPSTRRMATLPVENNIDAAINGGTNGAAAAPASPVDKRSLRNTSQRRRTQPMPSANSQSRTNGNTPEGERRTSRRTNGKPPSGKMPK